MSKEVEKKEYMAIVEPVAPTDKLLAGLQRFEELKKALLTDEDWQIIWVTVKDPDTGEKNRERKKFIRRTGFRKLALAFNLSTKLASEQRVDRPDGSFMWKIQVEVEAPNGRTSWGIAVCDSRERDFSQHQEHDVYSTAYTRALNRAISDMIAGGVVSAEEIEAEQQLPEKPTTKEALEGLREEARQIGQRTGVLPGPPKGSLSPNKLGKLKMPAKNPKIFQRLCTPEQNKEISELCERYVKEFGYNPTGDILKAAGSVSMISITWEQAEEAIKWLKGL